MAQVRASADVPGPVAEAEALWYETARWPSFVDGFGALHRQEGPWPKRGSSLVWDSRPGGRGRVLERVTAWEPRQGQTSQVEDEKLRGTQVLAFSPNGADARIELSMDYALKSGGPFMWITDLLFIRRAVRDSLRRTLVRFAQELEGDRALGVR